MTATYVLLRHLMWAASLPFTFAELVMPVPA